MERQATSPQSVGLHQAIKEKEKVEKERFQVLKRPEKKRGTTKDNNQVRPPRRQEQHLQRRELSK